MNIRSILVVVSIAFLFIHCSSDLKKPKSKINGALEALQLFTAQRAYPNKDIPNRANYQALEYVNRYMSNKNAPRFRFGWESKGPWNVAGRILSLAIDPNNDNLIFAGSASGGLWKSERLGADTSWTYVETGFPVLGVGAITINPMNSDEMYIGTGEVYNYTQTGQDAAYRMTRGSYGIGILKSEDGGKTWRKSLDWSYQQRAGVNAMQIDPDNPKIVYAATSEGVFKSVNGGDSWENVLDVIMMMDIVIDPNNPLVLVASAGNFDTPGKGIYRTDDGGETWSRANDIEESFRGKIRLEIHPEESNILYASMGDGFSTSGPTATWLYRSEDNGITWELVSEYDYSRWQGWFAHDVGVDPNDPDQIILAGVGTVRSEDGGQTIKWVNSGGNVLGRPEIGRPETLDTRYVHSDQHVVIYHPNRPNVAFIGSDGGVFMTTDNGRSFVSRNGALQTTQFYNGFSTSKQRFERAMGGLQDNSTVVYRGDKAWEKTLGGDGSWSAINPLDDNLLFASAQRLYMAKSTNNAASWYGLEVVDFDDNPVFIAPYAIAESSPNIMYACGKKVYKSISNGDSWYTTNGGEMINGDRIFSLAISKQDPDIVYVGTVPDLDPNSEEPPSPPQIFKTTDGGNSWRNISDNIPNRYPNDLVVDPNDDQIVYACFSGFGTGHLFKSKDGGESWNDISNNLPDIPGNAIAIDPNSPEHIYYGTDIGVFFSRTGGNSWFKWQKGLPYASIVMDLNIQTVDGSSLLWAATHGHGAYTRKLVKRIIANPIDKPSISDDAINELQLHLVSGMGEDAVIEIFDMNGRRVSPAKSYSLIQGDNYIEINHDHLQPGIYLISISSETSRNTIKYLKI